jgi:predicted nucleic acid-binding protein
VHESPTASTVRPKFALDTNIIIGAFERREADCRALVAAGRDGLALLAVSRTLDTELRSEFAKDDLWPYVKGLPRLPRPSASLGRLRLGEASPGYGGVGASLVGQKGDRQVDRNIRDGEHIDGADVWHADAFVTNERGLLRQGMVNRVKIITPADALVLINTRSG